MASVVIAAHNEEAVIGRTLDALLASAAGHSLEVVVSANGCTDQTVAVASRRGHELDVAQGVLLRDIDRRWDNIVADG